MCLQVNRFGKVKPVQKGKKQMVHLSGKLEEQILLILNPSHSQDDLSARII